MEEPIFRDVDQLEEIGRESVSVLVEEPAGVVEDDPGKVVETEGGVDVGLRLQVVRVSPVAPMKLVQHGLIRALDLRFKNKIIFIVLKFQITLSNSLIFKYCVASTCFLL